MEKNIYQEHGFQNIKEYLISVAEDFGVSKQKVFFLASVLGPSEDFDGLISSIEDYEGELE